MNWTLYFHQSQGVGTLSMEHQLFASINAPQLDERRWTFIEANGYTTYIVANDFNEACERLLHFMELPVKDFEVIESY
jgi:hypothetical protein